MVVPAVGFVVAVLGLRYYAERNGRVCQGMRKIKLGWWVSGEVEEQKRGGCMLVDRYPHEV